MLRLWMLNLTFIIIIIIIKSTVILTLIITDNKVPKLIQPRSVTQLLQSHKTDGQINILAVSSSSWFNDWLHQVGRARMVVRVQILADVRVPAYAASHENCLAAAWQASARCCRLVPTNQSRDESFSAVPHASHTAAPERRNPCTTRRTLPRPRPLRSSRKLRRSVWWLAELRGPCRCCRWLYVSPEHTHATSNLYTCTS